MKIKIISGIISAFILIFAATAAFAAANDVNIPEFINSIIRYEFDSTTDTPDAGSELGDFSVSHNGIMIFEPVESTNGWLFELADGNALNVEIGTLSSGDRYIDIAGVNGNVRYLNNSGSARDGYNMTQFWSAKQQDGSSITKDFYGEIKCAVLYEFPDGSCYLSGYIDGDGTDFWTLELPDANYFQFVKDSEFSIDIEESSFEIETTPSPLPASPSSVVFQKWQDAYAELLRTSDSENFYLCDIDKDEIPELLVQSFSEFSDTNKYAEYDVYSFNDGSIKYIGDFSTLSSSSLWIDNNGGILGYSNGAGAGGTYRAYVNNGLLCYDGEIYGYYYDGEGNYIEWFRDSDGNEVIVTEETEEEYKQILKNIIELERYDVTEENILKVIYGGV